MIRISEIRVTPRREARLRGYATITFNEVFVVRGLKIIEGKSGRLFVAMPSRRKPDGSYQDVAHPISQDFRDSLEKAILEEYTTALRAGAEEAPGSSDGTSDGPPAPELP